MSSQAGGLANSLNPPADSAPFTDVTSPLTTTRYRPRRPVSIPAQHPASPGRSEGGGYKVEKEVDKSTSMMAFWAQGEKTTSDAQKDKNRVALLQKRLDDAMDLLVVERRLNQEKERRYQETLRILESQQKAMSDRDATTN